MNPSEDETRLPGRDESACKREDLLEFLLENIPDRIYFKDRESRFICVSRAKAERHGVADPRELVGKTDFDLFTAEHAEATRQDEQQILRTGEAITGKVEKETLPDDRVRWALSTKMPLWNAKGEVIGTCGISKDVTALKEMEEAFAISNAELGRTLAELKQTHEALKGAQRQLVEAEKAQTAARLAAGVAHEVRNPLNILGAGIDFLSGELASGGDSATSAVMAEMRDAIQRADAVICALMVGSKDAPLNLDECDLNALIDAALAPRRRMFDERRIKVTTELAGNLPSLRLDAKKIATVMDGILLNALDAMGEDGGQFFIRTAVEAPAASGAEREPGDRSGQRQRAGASVVSVMIEDSGCGIPAESLQAIFDPFFTTKETGSGTGLGLTVCRKIIELHHGSIEIANRPECGARVRIVLPV